MLDYLLDAMNEISDEHIVEAVNFEAKAKKLSFKKLIPIAACFVLVIVAVLAGVGLFEVVTPDVTVTTIGGDTPTDAITLTPTQAPAPNTTQPIVQCPPIRDWEDLTYGERFNTITIQDVKYRYSYERVDANKIGEHIITEEVSKEYLLNDWHSATAEVYKIKGISTDIYVAIKFNEDESGEYFLFNKPDYAPKTLGDFLDDIDANNNINFIESSAIYNDFELNGDLIEIVYKTDVKGHKKLFGLLWGNRDALSYSRSLNDSNSERLTVRFEIMGTQATIYLRQSGIINQKTHLYILYSGFLDNTLCFDLDDNAFSEYMNFLQSEAEVIRSSLFHDGTHLFYENGTTMLYDVGTTEPLYDEPSTVTTTVGTTAILTNENLTEMY